MEGRGERRRRVGGEWIDWRRRRDEGEGMDRRQSAGGGGKEEV